MEKLAERLDSAADALTTVDRSLSAHAASASGPLWSSRTVSTVPPSSWASREYVRSMVATPKGSPPRQRMASCGRISVTVTGNGLVRIIVA